MGGDTLGNRHPWQEPWVPTPREVFGLTVVRRDTTRL